MVAAVKRIDEIGKGMLAVIKDCPLCGHESEMIVWREHYEYWVVTGDDNAFPRLNPSQRETLISGSHEICYDKEHNSGRTDAAQDDHPGNDGASGAF